MMIGILCSTFREGPPFLSTLRSAIAARPDFILVDDGPIGANAPAGDATPLELAGELGDDAAVSGIVVDISAGKTHESDAAKRTHLLNRAKTTANRMHRMQNEPLWLLWLDGDELLVFPETFRDVCYRASFETGAGGFQFRIVELDGSVALTQGKVINADFVTRYLESSYQVELRNGMIVALPNVKICSSGGIPFMDAETQQRMMSSPDAQDEVMSIHRPPVAGEPHLLHRSILRHPDRTAGGVERQSEAEGRWFREILGPDGESLSKVTIR